jgi:hypothetical protein
MTECPVCHQEQRRYLSTAQYAQLAGILPETVANLCQDGRIAGAERVQVGRRPHSAVWRIEINQETVNILNNHRASRSSAQAAQAAKRRRLQASSFSEREQH